MAESIYKMVKCQQIDIPKEDQYATGRRISADSRISHRIVDPLSESRIQYATIRKSSDIRIGYQILGSLLFQLNIAV